MAHVLVGRFSAETLACQYGIADWLAAGATYNPDQNPQDWLNANANRMLFHPITVRSLGFILTKVGLQWPQ